MARPKQKAEAERSTVIVNYTIIPYFAIECDDPKLSGIRGVGPTPLKALTNMKGEVMKRYPAGQHKVIERITNPEFVGAWRLPEPE